MEPIAPVEFAPQLAISAPVATPGVVRTISVDSIQVGPEITLGTGLDGFPVMAQLENLITTFITYDATGQVVRSTSARTGSRYDIVA